MFYGVIISTMNLTAAFGPDAVPFKFTTTRYSDYFHCRKAPVDTHHYLHEAISIMEFGCKTSNFTQMTLLIRIRLYE